MKTLMLTILSVFLVACAARGPAYQTPSAPAIGFANILIYRFANGYGGAYPVDIAINASEKVASINEQGYTVVQLRADGREHVIRSGPNNSIMKVTLTPTSGETYYIKYVAGAPIGSLSAGGLASIVKKPKNPLAIMPPEVASKEIIEYKFQPALQPRIE